MYSTCVHLNFSDIKDVKEHKHHFEKISGELDTVHLRNSQVPRNKHPEVEEVQNLLLATRSCFGHTALDYVYQISRLQTKKRHEIIGTVSFYSKLFYFCCVFTKIAYLLIFVYS